MCEKRDIIFFMGNESSIYTSFTILRQFKYLSTGLVAHWCNKSGNYLQIVPIYKNLSLSTLPKTIFRILFKKKKTSLHRPETINLTSRMPVHKMT